MAVFFLFLSCKKEVVEAPQGLISKDKMINIMYDLSLLDGLKYQSNDLRDSVEINPSKYIFEKYKVDSLQFAKSNVYYASNYVEYKEMFDTIIKRLDSKKIVLDSVIKIQKKKDSIADKKKKPELKLDTLSKGVDLDKAIERKRKRNAASLEVAKNALPTSNR